MIPNLVRPSFLDRWWDVADLDVAAEFWLRLYEEVARVNGFAVTPVHRTEIRLRGFSRATADALLRELAIRVSESDFPAPEADLPDPDLLVISSGEVHGDDHAPSGLGLPVLIAPAFDGLMAEIRFEVVGDERKTLRKVNLESTLVLVGELRGGRFLLKAVWRAGFQGWEDKLCWDAPWPEQETWFAALDAFRETAAVPKALAKKLFQPRGSDRATARILRIVHVPLDAPRFSGLMCRIGLFAAMLFLVALGIRWAVARDHPLVWILLCGALGVTLGHLYFFCRIEWRYGIVAYHRSRAAYARLYVEAILHVSLTRAEADARLDNPWARKYTADLEAAGFRYLGDMRLEPARTIGNGIFRVFHALDGMTYLTVFFYRGTAEDVEPAFQNWPAEVALLGHTYFADGGFASTASGRSIGYRKKRTGPEHFARVFPNAHDPIEFARRHAAAAEQFAIETSRRPIPHQPFEFFLRKQKEQTEDDRRLFADRPYTCGDHLHWYLQWLRKEYRA